MKTILVDAVHSFVIAGEGIFADISFREFVNAFSA